MATLAETVATTSEVRDFDPNRGPGEMGFEYDVTMVSSYDTSYPCENITHGTGTGFWTTTGTYPQCLVITLKETTHVKTLELFSCNVKELRIEGTPESEPHNFEEITQQEIPSGNLQKTTVSDISGDYKHIKFVILSGHEHFASLHDISVS